MKKFLEVMLLVVGLSVPAMAAINVYDASLFEGLVASSAIYTLDCQQIDYLSFQAAASTASTVNYSTYTFTDGVKSTGTIVFKYNTNLDNAIVNVNGFNYIEGIHWNRGATAALSAASLYGVLSSTSYVYNGYNSTGTIAVMYLAFR